jgi:hypothetical protein
MGPPVDPLPTGSTLKSLASSTPGRIIEEPLSHAFQVEKAFGLIVRSFARARICTPTGRQETER